MSPRISSLEAMTHPLSMNPLKRRWEVIQLVAEASTESGIVDKIRVDGFFLGRAALVEALNVIELSEREPEAVDWDNLNHVAKLEEGEV